MTFDVDISHAGSLKFLGRARRSRSYVRMKIVRCSAVDACYVVTCVHFESPGGSTKRAHKTYTIYWLFVESFMLKWSVRDMSFQFLTANAKASVA